MIFKMNNSLLISNLNQIEKFKDQDWLENEANCKLVFESTNLLNGDLLNPLYKLIPFALKLADNYLVSNKILGIKCLKLILNKFDIIDLSKQGLDNLIFDTFKRLLFNQEVEVINLLLPAFLDSIQKMKSSLLNSDQIITECDLVLIQIIQNMEMMTKFNLKMAYLNHLESFIKLMETDIAKHFKRLLSLLISILEEVNIHFDFYYFSCILKSLNTLIEQTQPIDEKYFSQILLSLIKFQSSLLEIKTKEDENKLLNRLINQCILKLKESNCKQFEDYIMIVKKSCEDNHLMEALNIQ